MMSSGGDGLTSSEKVTPIVEHSRRISKEQQKLEAMNNILDSQLSMLKLENLQKHHNKIKKVPSFGIIMDEPLTQHEDR